MPITEKQFDWAMQILADPESKAAKARAAHEHMSDLDKVVLAKLMNDAPDECKSQAAKESYARAHPSFEAHLEQKKVLSEMDYRARDSRSAASAIIDAWRTEQSNARMFTKAA